MVTSRLSAFVPLSVARPWTYAGQETLLAPIAFAAIVSACTVLTAGCSTERAGGAAQGCLAVAVILACPSFVRYTPSQCADIALGFFIVAAFVAWSSAEQQRLWLMLAELSAGLAAWTKNEGAGFFVVFVTAVAIQRLCSVGSRRLLDLAPVLVGAAPVLVAVVLFEQTPAAPSYVRGGADAGPGGHGPVPRLESADLAVERDRRGVIPSCAPLRPYGVSPTAPAAARAAVPKMAAVIAIYAIAYLVSPIFFLAIADVTRPADRATRAHAGVVDHPPSADKVPQPISCDSCGSR